MISVRMIRLLLTGIFLLLCTALEPVSADWKGRFDLGGNPVFYDDEMLEDRTPLTSGLRLQFTPGSGDNWIFKANLKLRTEANSPDGNQLRLRDLYVRYGNDSEQSLGSVTAGVFTPEGISGIGDIMGAGIQLNIPAGETSRFGFGAFGGANSAVRDGATDADGVRYGGYLIASGEAWGRMSLAYVSVSDTEFAAQESSYIAFNTSLRLSDRFDFQQSGEFTVSSETDDDSTLTSYFADAGYEFTERLRISVTYDRFDRMPYLASTQYEEVSGSPNPEDFDRFSAFSGQSIGPRVDFQLSPEWRAFTRYRYKKTDDFLSQTWHQYLLGFGYMNPVGKGISINGSIFINKGDTKEFETGFLRIGRDFGPSMNLSLNFAADRFAYPETIASAPHVDSTWRTGVSGFFRIRPDMTALMEYERTFGDEERDGDHRVMFNWQYRF